MMEVPKSRKQKSNYEPDFSIQKKDFMGELLGKIVAVKLVDEEAPLVGKVVEHTPYWLKIEDGVGRIIYINKAHVKTIIPVK